MELAKRFRITTRLLLINAIHKRLMSASSDVRYTTLVASMKLYGECCSLPQLGGQ